MEYPAKLPFLGDVPLKPFKTSIYNHLQGFSHCHIWFPEGTNVELRLDIDAGPVDVCPSMACARLMASTRFGTSVLAVASAVLQYASYNDHSWDSWISSPLVKACFSGVANVFKHMPLKFPHDMWTVVRKLWLALAPKLQQDTASRVDTIHCSESPSPSIQTQPPWFIMASMSPAIASDEINLGLLVLLLLLARRGLFELGNASIWLGRKLGNLQKIWIWRLIMIMMYMIMTMMHSNTLANYQ